jgi:hypothetical protein
MCEACKSAIVGSLENLELVESDPFVRTVIYRCLHCGAQWLYTEKLPDQLTELDADGSIKMHLDPATHWAVSSFGTPASLDLALGLSHRSGLRKEMEQEIKRAYRGWLALQQPLDRAGTLIVLVLIPFWLLAMDWIFLQDMKQSPVQTPCMHLGAVAAWFDVLTNRRRHQSIRRFLAGLCPDCGYDICESTDCCSECGNRLQ